MGDAMDDVDLGPVENGQSDVLRHYTRDCDL